MFVLFSHHRLSLCFTNKFIETKSILMNAIFNFYIRWKREIASIWDTCGIEKIFVFFMLLEVNTQKYFLSLINYFP